MDKLFVSNPEDTEILHNYFSETEETRQDCGTCGVADEVKND